MEVMRDNNDNVVIICSIENFDPMGVHTGDSITVAPAQTLTDKEYQRDARRRDRGHPRDRRRDRRLEHSVRDQSADGRMVVIEMNPRVSRSSALASKATGFRSRRSPRSSRSATRSTSCRTTSPARRRPASSRRSTTSSPRSRAWPSKISRRRRHADDADEVRRRSDGDRPHVQGSAAKGAALARDRARSASMKWNFGSAGRPGWSEQIGHHRGAGSAQRRPHSSRGRGVPAWACPSRRCIAPDRIDPWFLRADRGDVVATEVELRKSGLPTTGPELHRLKQLGFSDARIAHLCDGPKRTIAQRRAELEVSRFQTHRHLRGGVRFLHALSLFQLRR